MQEKVQRHSQTGFALLEIIIVVAIIALLFGGGWYVKNLQEQQNTIQTGIDATQQAKDVVDQLNAQSEAEQSQLDTFNPVP